jgi:cell division septation protein DedD
LVAEAPSSSVFENQVAPPKPASLAGVASPAVFPTKPKTTEKKQDQSLAFIKTIKEEPIPKKEETKKIKEAKKAVPAATLQPVNKAPLPKPAGALIPPVAVSPPITAAIIPPARVTPPVVESVPTPESAAPIVQVPQAGDAPPAGSDIVAVPLPLQEPKQPEVKKQEVKKRVAGQYSIQFGSFPKKEEADQLVSQLKARGHDPYIILAEVPNKGTFYRVRVGRYPDRPMAQAAGEKIAHEESLAFYVASD